MTIFEKLGFKDKKDFLYNWGQNTEEIQEVKELLSDLAWADLKDKSFAVRSKNQLVEFLRVDIGRENVEKFKVFFLNAKNQIIGSETLFSGTVDRSAVYPRLIMERVFKYSARSVVFAHNHPSGDCKPSVKDVELTNQIKDCFRLLDVTVLDHVIISKNEYFSFLEEGII